MSPHGHPRKHRLLHAKSLMELSVRVELPLWTSLSLCLGDVSHHRPYTLLVQVTGVNRGSCDPTMPGNLHKAPTLFYSSTSALEKASWASSPAPPWGSLSLPPDWDSPRRTHHTPELGALYSSPQQPRDTFLGMGCDLNKNIYHGEKSQKINTGRDSLYASYFRNAVFYWDEQGHLCSAKEGSILVLSAGQ